MTAEQAYMVKESPKKESTEEIDIQSLTVTQNGTYTASSHGCDGFNPVTVNIPQETLYNWATESSKWTTDDSSETPTEYTFPSGTEYSEVYDLTHLMVSQMICSVTDNTAGYTIRITYSEEGEYLDDSNTYYEVIGTVDFGVYNSDGERVNGFSWSYVPQAYYEDEMKVREYRSLVSYTIDSTTGTVNYTIKYTYTNTPTSSGSGAVEGGEETNDYQCTIPQLIGWGESGHTYTVTKLTS